MSTNMVFKKNPKHSTNHALIDIIEKKAQH